MKTIPTTKLAFSISGLSDATTVGRTRIYEEIRSGRLRAIKCGNRTIITGPDAETWLKNLYPVAVAVSDGDE